MPLLRLFGREIRGSVWLVEYPGPKASQNTRRTTP